MTTSVHYAKFNGQASLSKNKLELIHNLVNTAKAFLKNGKTSYGRAFHCCFAIEHGKVKEVGFNSYKQRIDYLPRLGKVKKFSDDTYAMGLHAEISAILKLGETDFSKMSFLNVHVDRNSRCRTSRPCKNCLRMMKIVGVKECIYFDDEKNEWLTLKTKLVDNL